MKSTKLALLLNAALGGLAISSSPLTAYAATLNAGDILTINPGIAVTSPAANATVSWFAMDNSGDSKIQGGEKVALSQGTNGIVIGATTTAGSFHGGAPVAGDTGPIVAPWGFFGATGTNFNTVAITGDTTAGLNMSGWKVSWNNVSNIDMGSGAWTPLNAIPGVPASGYTTGTALFSWSGTCGDPYLLNYGATVPGSSPSFPGVQYFLHLEGTVLNASCGGIVATSPAHQAVGLDAPTTNSISITFNQAMSGVTSAFLSVSATASTVTVGSPTASSGNKTFTFPITGVAGGKTYTMTFNSAGVTPASGPLATATFVTRTFSTFLDNTAPTLVSTNPANGATTIPPNTGNITVTFSEPMTGVTASAVSISGGVSVGTPIASGSNKIFTFPITGLSASTSYTLTFNAGPKDVSNNALTPPAAVTFSTTSGGPPTLSAATNDKLLVCSGSSFGMEISAANTTFTSIEQKNPITIGIAQGATGANHLGAKTDSELTPIDKPWEFFGSTGYHFTDVAITDKGDGTLDFSGWRVGWNNVPSINMGSGLPATFTWDGVYGHAYTVTYNAIVPNGDPSGFGGVPYSLYLTGKVAGGPANVVAVCGDIITSEKGVIFEVSGVAGAKLALNSQLRPDDPVLIQAGYSVAGRPEGYDFYKFGIVTYTISGLTPGAGQTATVTMTLPQNVPAGTRIYKVTQTGGYQEITSQTTIAGATVVLNIQDDGPLDSCKTASGCAGGVIIDPIAIAIPFATTTGGTSGGAGGGVGGGGCAHNPSARFDPTLLAMLLGGLGYLRWKRRASSDPR